MSRQESDDAGFIALVEREYRGAVATAAIIIGNSAVAEEIAQEVFERTYRHWHKVSILDKPGAWVRRSVINKAISMTRSQGSERRAIKRVAAEQVISLSDGSTFGESAPVYALAGSELWAAVKDLPPAQATALALHYGADLSIESVAAEMVLSESAVKSLLHRARAQLRGNTLLKEAVQ